MGDISRKRKTYERVEHEVMVDLPPAWAFELDDRTWDFEELAKWGGREDLAYHFSVVFWQRRYELRHETRDYHWSAFKVFWSFLDVVYPEVTDVAELTTEVLQSYRSWLSYTKVKTSRWDKQTGEPTAQGTQRKYYSVIKNMLLRMMADGALKQDIEFPVVAFSNTVYNEKQSVPYSRAERQRIVDACKKQIDAIKNDDFQKDRLGMLVPYMLLMALRTGINVQPLLDLRTDSLKPGVIDGRMVLTAHKNRGYSSQNIDVTESNDERFHVTKRVAGLFEEVLELTASLREQAPEELKNVLWLIRDRYDESKTKTVNSNSVYTAITEFAERYDLRNDQGEPLNLNLRRMRPTFAHTLLRINGGDLRDLQRRLNHKSIATTMRYLDPEQDEFKSSFKHRGLVMQQWIMGASGDVNVEETAAQMGITMDEAEKVISGANDMLVGSCKNPMNSKFNDDNQSACTNFMACFRCENQVITHKDLHKVFSFYWYLLSKKPVIPEKAWNKAYEWIIRVIDEDIVPQVASTMDVDSLRNEARINPHPAWANRNLAVAELGSLA